MSEQLLQTTLHLTLLGWAIWGMLAAFALIIGAIWLLRQAKRRKQATQEYERNNS